MCRRIIKGLWYNRRYCICSYITLYRSYYDIRYRGAEEKYVPDLASGKKIGAFGLTEPGAGTDAQGCQTKAVLDGDEWVLNGSKCFITNGKVADVYIIIAITSITEDKRGRKKKNFSAFIVDKGTPGFSFGTKEKKMGIRGSSTYELIFEDARIPRMHYLERGKRFPNRYAYT